MKKKMRVLCLLTAMMLAYGGAFSVSAAEGKVIVSLGDSYSSGEGIEPFYGQEEEIGERVQNPDWLAHRSEKSWPGMLTLPGVEGSMKDHRGENWFFAAATGAKSEHLYLLTGEEKQEGMTAEQEKEYNRDNHSGKALLAPQLDIFDELDAKGLKADYVTVTIGGNDIGFPSMVKMAIARVYDLVIDMTVEEQAEKLWNNYYTATGTREKIKRAYRDIAARAGEQACILSAGYPRILDPDQGDIYFSSHTIEVIIELTRLFNRELQDLAEECRGEGINIRFVPVEEAFEGHGAYSEDNWINPVMLTAQAQDLDESVIGSIYSMHPNEKGARGYAACVQAVIDSLEAGSEK